MACAAPVSGKKKVWNAVSSNFPLCSLPFVFDPISYYLLSIHRTGTGTNYRYSRQESMDRKMYRFYQNGSTNGKLWRENQNGTRFGTFPQIGT
jgi:hypothetical protein